MPGTRPISASMPKRMLVPGTMKAVSSRLASASSRAIRTARDRGRVKSNGGLRYCALLIRADMGVWGRNARRTQRACYVFRHRTVDFIRLPAPGRQTKGGPHGPPSYAGLYRSSERVARGNPAGVAENIG